jgi:uncharacterized protein YyaL (SSP411 family)
METPANHLLGQKSPYLLQHVHNPVDWHPWGEEAFSKAREEDKPIFLSIGYSTCHWCHVMEKESFENNSVAEILNRTFISIKVDREERPDIDTVYMAVCQAMSGSGGWPLSIIMTPEKKPFFATTYIPRESRFGMLGMLDVLPKIENLWKNNRNDILSSAGKVADAMKQNAEIKFKAEIEPGLPEKAFNEISSTFDNVNGGYGNAPKFPSAHRLIFLLRYSQLSGNSEIRSQIEFTLEKMSAGGIYDQIGGGFHRYSTDEKWLLPHFEKMLYDQALLAIAYTEAYQATGREDFAASARDILNYVIRDMTSPEGAFYSAEDADSEGEEGKFYVWDYKELFAVLPNDDALIAVRYFNVDDEGNFTDPVHGNSGKNIFHLNKSKAKIASEFEISQQELESRLSKIREKLFQHREKRVKPSKDTKILADWNGLMIAAMAKASGVFNCEDYMKSAARASDFILARMRNGKGEMFHRSMDGENAVEGQLDDYAFMVWGLIELYEAGFDVKYLQAALELNKIAISNFRDSVHENYYMTGEKSEKMIFRPKVNFDGALPSGNSVQAMNLLRLSGFTADTDFEMLAAESLNASAQLINRYPGSFTNYLNALLYAENSSEIVICGKSKSKTATEYANILRSKYLPFKSLLFVPENEAEASIFKIASFAKDYKMLDGKSTVYVCKKHICSKPVTDIEEALTDIGGELN